jgi:hypothetical protein
LCHFNCFFAVFPWNDSIATDHTWQTSKKISKATQKIFLSSPITNKKGYPTSMKLNSSSADTHAANCELFADFFESVYDDGDEHLHDTQSPEG